MRLEILDSAGKVFRRDGYHGATIDTVAAEAGYTKGAVFSNFDSKEDLFLAVYAAEVGRRFERLLPAFRTSSVRDAMAEYTTVQQEDPAWSVVQVEFTLHAASKPECLARLAAITAQLRSRMLEQARERLGLDHARAGRLVSAILIVVSGAVVEGLTGPLPKGLAEDMVAAFAEGLNRE